MMLCAVFFFLCAGLLSRLLACKSLYFCVSRFWKWAKKGEWRDSKGFVRRWKLLAIVKFIRIICFWLFKKEVELGGWKGLKRCIEGRTNQRKWAYIFPPCSNSSLPLLYYWIVSIISQCACSRCHFTWLAAHKAYKKFLASYMSEGKAAPEFMFIESHSLKMTDTQQ